MFRFDERRDLREVESPQAAPNVRSYTYDDDHNRLTATDELEHTWTFTYGAVGNVLTATSPLASPAQVWTVTWAQPEPTERPNFWRVTEVEDPAGDNRSLLQNPREARKHGAIPEGNAAEGGCGPFLQRTAKSISPQSRFPACSPARLLTAAGPPIIPPECPRAE